MPHYTVHIREDLLDGDAAPRLIGALTDAVAGVYGAWARQAAGVTLFGVPGERWGVGGAPHGHGAPVVRLNVREGAFRHPDVPDAAARLIAGTTDAVAGVLGEEVRERVVVVLEGIPRGRSGVGGQVV